MKIKNNDQVKVTAGKDKGKKGKVLRVFPKKNQAIVEGINFIKRHTRKTQQDQKGGVVQKEAPIHISNLTVICPKCNKAVKMAIAILTNGEKTRVCKKCEETL